MIRTILLPIMRVLGTLTLSVTMVIGGPIAQSLSQVPDAQPTENNDTTAGFPDGCVATSYQETPPCSLGE